MKLIGGLIAGIAIGIVLFAIVGLGFLTPTPADPAAAYCRGFAEGYHYAYLKNTGIGIDQTMTDSNEAWCVSEAPFALDGWGLRGPLVP